MARPLRIEYPGALYHITNRGNARQAIFSDTVDREAFLALLAEVIERFAWLCHAYCLMDNHYHLVAETPDPDLSVGMRHLNGVYTQRFNRRHKRIGHLFQGRFKAILVERDSHLLELARYVVLNPVRAGMVADVTDYPWSSYRATTGLAPVPEWLTVDWIRAQFGKTAAVAQRRYTDFVAQGLTAPSPWSQLKGQTLLGSEAFAAKIRPLVEERGELAEVPRIQRLVHRPELGLLFPKTVRLSKAARDEAIRQAYTEYVTPWLPSPLRQQQASTIRQSARSSGVSDKP